MCLGPLPGPGRAARGARVQRHVSRVDGGRVPASPEPPTPPRHGWRLEIGQARDRASSSLSGLDDTAKASDVRPGECQSHDGDGLANNLTPFSGTARCKCTECAASTTYLTYLEIPEVSVLLELLLVD